jgi:hypothetical protein
MLGPAADPICEALEPASVVAGAGAPALPAVPAGPPVTGGVTIAAGDCSLHASNAAHEKQISATRACCLRNGTMIVLPFRLTAGARLQEHE